MLPAGFPESCGHLWRWHAIPRVRSHLLPDLPSTRFLFFFSPGLFFSLIAPPWAHRGWEGDSWGKPGPPGLSSGGCWWPGVRAGVPDGVKPINYLEGSEIELIHPEVHRPKGVAPG